MKFSVAAIMVMFAFLSGCSSPDRKAAEILDTAQFEEKQGNLEHAAKLYAEIIRDYSSTPAAKHATVRLSGITAIKK